MIKITYKMPPPGLSGCMAEALFSGCPSIRSSVTKLGKTIFCKQISDVALMKISTSGPRGKGIEQWSTVGVRRSKIKVIYKVELDASVRPPNQPSTDASVILDPFESSSFSSSRLQLFMYLIYIFSCSVSVFHIIVNTVLLNVSEASTNKLQF